MDGADLLGGVRLVPFYGVEDHASIATLRLRYAIGRACRVTGLRERQRQYAEEVARRLLDGLRETQRPRPRRTREPELPDGDRLRDLLRRALDEVDQYLGVPCDLLKARIGDEIGDEIARLDALRRQPEPDAALFSRHCPETPDPPELWTPFVDDMELVLPIVQEAYADALGGTPLNCRAEIALEERHVDRDHADRESVERRLNGLVSFIAGNDGEGAEGRRRVRVTILLAPHPGLNRAFGLAYLAAHEFGVHVPQQWGDDALAAEGDEGCCQFSEGLMDAAIVDLLHDELTMQRHPDAADYVQAADLRFNERQFHDLPAWARDFPGDWETQLQSGRTGWKALTEMGRALAREPVAADLEADEAHAGDALHGLRWARAVALKVNVLPLPARLRGALAEALAAARYETPFAGCAEEPRLPDGSLKAGKALFDLLNALLRDLPLDRLACEFRRRAPEIPMIARFLED